MKRTVIIAVLMLMLIVLLTAAVISPAFATNYFFDHFLGSSLGPDWILISGTPVISSSMMAFASDGDMISVNSFDYSSGMVEWYGTLHDGDFLEIGDVGTGEFGNCQNNCAYFSAYEAGVGSADMACGWDSGLAETAGTPHRYWIAWADTGVWTLGYDSTTVYTSPACAFPAGDMVIDINSNQPGEGGIDWVAVSSDGYETETPTATGLAATATYTPIPTRTQTAATQAVIVIETGDGGAVLINRSVSYGDVYVVTAIAALFSLVALYWAYQWTKEHIRVQE